MRGFGQLIDHRTRGGEGGLGGEGGRGYRDPSPREDLYDMARLASLGRIHTSLTPGLHVGPYR